MVFPVVIFVAVPVVIEALEQDDAACILIAKKCDCIVCSLLQIAEADDISVSFNGIQNAIGSGIGLNQPVHFQIFVDPQCIERSRIEPREEHIYDDQQIDFPVLHALGQVFVVVLETIGRSIEVRVERSIVILDSAFEKIARCLVEGIGVEAFLLQNTCLSGRQVFGVFLVCGVAENRGNRKLAVALGNLLLELRVILHRHGNRADGKHGIKTRHALAFQGIETVALGLLIEMLQRIFDDFPDTLWRTHRPLDVDGRNRLVFDVFLFLDRIDIVDAERKHIAVIDGIDNRISMELIAKGLRRGQ